MKRFVWIVVLLALAGGAAYWYWHKSSTQAATFRTAKVERGDLLVTVSATGTVQPVTQVQVGTQVTGTILMLGPDSDHQVDFNSHVTAGQVIAQIDPASFQARVDQDKANLARAKADIDRIKASLVQAEKELARSRELAKRDLISASELDAAVASYDSLAAQIKVAEATVAQSEATLKISQVNLNYTTIISPVDGVIVSRNVDVGQTVAASLQAPTLFVIADNLKKIQIQASVAEADIGKISDGQTATFTVDAYRNLSFQGKVFQVRLSPTTVQNVVTYTVMIAADNPDEKLLPGMTASVTFEVDRQTGALKIPNAALRFTPPPELAAEPPTPAPAPAPKKPDGPPRERGRGTRGRVWIQSPGGVTAVPIVSGATDGAFTQILKGELQEGQEIVIGISQEGKDAPMTNPFAPPRIGGPGGGGRPR